MLLLKQCSSFLQLKKMSLKRQIKAFTTKHQFHSLFTFNRSKWLQVVSLAKSKNDY